MSQITSSKAAGFNRRIVTCSLKFPTSETDAPEFILVLTHNYRALATSVAGVDELPGNRIQVLVSPGPKGR